MTIPTAIPRAMKKVSFANAGRLATSDGEYPSGFQIAGADKVFRWAEAARGPDGRTYSSSPTRRRKGITPFSSPAFPPELSIF